MNRLGLDLDRFCDDKLGEAAEQLFGKIQTGDKPPVGRTQIYGLRQIAEQGPSKVKEFAEKQGERAERRRSKGALEEKEFWRKISEFLGPEKKGTLTLEELIKQFLMPAAEALEVGAGSPEQGATTGSRPTAHQKTMLEQLKKEVIPLFFRRFCVHYCHVFRNQLFESAKRGGN